MRRAGLKFLFFHQLMYNHMPSQYIYIYIYIND